ncbi:hypothetical protein CK477_11860 [Enterobacter cloacae]|nr:hypothetical protein CK477_11860 [Enterobacter cloacae]
MKITYPRSQELKTSRSQNKRLQTVIDKLTDMSIDWDGLSGGLECDLNMLVSDTEKLLDVNEERCVHDISF